jgi:glycosyltransferase involved in cell wall biosynthesis
MADTERDIRIAAAWGFSSEKPFLIIPGSGGIQLPAMIGSKFGNSFPQELPEARIVVNPRGSRPGSLRQDLFLQAIPLVLEKVPSAFFICPSLASDIECRKMVERLGINNKIWLWPRIGQLQLWALYQKSIVYVSPSVHDGTPNSLLEAMSCGCFPVVGNIESMREWITQDINGFLVDANSSQSIANGIIQALESPTLLEGARNKNASIIAERAEYQCCMAKAEAFLEKILD